MESCRMHDLVHDLARAVAGNEFAFSGTHDQTALKKTRHLSMYSVPEVALKKHMEAFKNFDKMRSMVFFRMNSKYNISEVNVCFRFRRLRLLVLRKIRINHLPKSIGKLKHLRYLDLSHTGIKELPKTICNLFNLQTLILVGTRIKKFPKGIRRMISLRHVQLGGYTKHMPNGIGELTSLRTLSEFIVGEKSGCGIEELKFLNLLMGHLRIERLDNIKNAQCAREASLKEKKYLRSLILSYGKVGDTPEGNLDNVIQYLEPHSRLERLSIYDYMGRNFPTWMEQINLVKLSLYNCQRCQHLPRLGRLRFLESLRLEQMDGLKYIIEFDSGYDKKSMFPSLKHLQIFDLCNLKGWSIDGVDGVVPSEPDDQLLPRLCKLFVHNCPNLTSFPKGLGALEELRMINVGCSKLDISSSLSLKILVLSEMPNLEGLSTQQVASNDGQAKVEAHLFLRCLLSLDISTCLKLTHFPSLVLPALESFMMRGVGLHKIQLISSSLSIETISISSMPNLESRSSQAEDDNDRQENKTGRSDNGRLSTVIVECPEMIDMPQLLPSLDKLYIRKSNEKLLRSIAHYTSLSSLTINGFPEMTSLPLHVFGPNHTNLHELIIEDCPKLMFLSDWLENLPALKTMKIDECPDLVLMLPDGLHQHWLSSLQDLKIMNSCKKQTVFPGGDGIVFHSLRKLYMEGWESLESLCEGLQQNLIPTLQELTIFKCPNLVPFPNGFQQQCLNSLKVLRIWYCKKLTSFPGGGGDAITLSSLKELEIFRCENLKHMFEGLKENHISSLEKMSIIDCPKLDDLPEWLGNLSLLEELSINSCPCLRGLPESVKNFTSLRRLEIRNCPNMNALPTELQKLLSDEQLQIYNCPLLERRMQCNDKDESTHAARILPQRLMELLKKTPCINPSSSSFS